jgi:transcriptional regulator with XRE-family HTH domain
LIATFKLQTNTLTLHYTTMKVGNNIREVREQKKWSQEYMADLLGMSVNGYGKIERNEVDINIEKLQQVAQLFEIKPEDLLKDGFNFTNTGDNNNYFSTIYQQSTKIEKLYEEQIVLLKDKIAELEKAFGKK